MRIELVAMQFWNTKIPSKRFTIQHKLHYRRNPKYVETIAVDKEFSQTNSGGSSNKEQSRSTM